MELWSIIFTAIISFGTFAASLIGLQYFWLRPHNSDIPMESSTPARLVRQNSIREEDYTKIKNLRELLEKYVPIAMKLDPRYWIRNIGLDGYAYLYYQRELIKLLVTLGFVSFLVLVPLSMWFENMETIEKPITTGLVTEDHRLLGETKPKHQELRSIMDCLLIYFFSLYTVYIMYRIKNHIGLALREERKKRAEIYDYERLRARSVHVRGLFKEDRKGEIMCSIVGNVLEENGGGRVVSCVVVPDFVKIVDFENDRKRIDDAHKLFVANEPAVRRMLFPRKYRQEQYFERKLRTIDDKIEAETMKPVICSGHAFVCFDTVNTRNRCLELFKENTRQIFEACCTLITDKETFLPEHKQQYKRRQTSTFQKFDQEDVERSLKEKNHAIFMNALESPVEIFWANLGGDRGFFILRRILINAIAFLILVFLSTPASLLTALQQIKILQFIDLSSYAKDDSAFATFLKQTMPPVLIILLNQLLLLLIDYAAYMERHRSFTLCQISIFYKSLFYLTLNMLIIPALTLATADSLFEMIIHETHSIAQILKQFYFSSPGGFFINILLQNGAFSSSFHMLRIGDMLNAFGSTWLAHYQRTYLNDAEKWRKKESDVFQYGYLYAQIVTAFAIIIAYSVSTPGILVAGIVFLLMRYLVDGFNILTVFKREIDSEGKLIEPILVYTGSSVLLLQIALIISFGYSGFKISCALCSLLFAVTLLLVFKLSTPIATTEENTMEDSAAELRDTRQNIENWEAAYRHPLLVSNTEAGASRQTRQISYIVPE